MEINAMKMNSLNLRGHYTARRGGMKRQQIMSNLNFNLLSIECELYPSVESHKLKI
jgi:hypothetical protein